MNKISSIDICEGVSFSHIDSKKFKNFGISFVFFSPIEEKLASNLSVLISVLSDSCKKFQNFKDLNKQLEEMYGACLDYCISKIGNYHVVDLSILATDDRFTINNEKNISKVVDLICELIFNPLVSGDSFNDQIVSRRKREIIELIDAQISNKRTWSLIKCKQNMFKNEKCGISKYGSKSEVLKITGESLFKVYKSMLESSRVKIMMVSSSDCNDIVEKLKKKFESIKRNVSFDFEPNKFVIPNESKNISENMKVQQCKFVMGFRTPFIKPQKTHAMSLLSAIFGGIPTSKLFMSVREKMNLCYYCSSRFDSATGAMYVESGIEESNFEKAKSEILNQLTKIQNGEITDEEINDAKNYLIQRANSISDSMGRFQDWFICQYPFGQSETPEEYAKEISEVSKKDVIDCSSKIYLDTVYVLKKED